MQTATPGNRLRELREAADLELYDVAAIVRKSPSMVSRYETGKSEPPLDVLQILARRYDVTIEHLLGWDRAEAPAA